MTHDITLLLVGAASGVVVAFFGGLLSFVTTSVTQGTQHVRDLELLAGQIEAERQTKSDDAARQIRRDRLQPVLDLMTEMEGFLAYKLWSESMNEQRDAISRSVLLPLVGADNVEEAWKVARERIMKGVEYDPQWNSIVARALIASLRIGDRNLRAELMLFPIAMQSAGFDLSQGSIRLGELHNRMEEYAAMIATKTALSSQPIGA